MIGGAIALGAALLLSIFPGAAIASPRNVDRDDSLQRLGTSVATSWAFWACLIWILPRGCWTAGAAMIVGAATLAWGVRRVRERRGRSKGSSLRAKGLGAVAAALLLSVTWRVATTFARKPPSTGDLTMHAYMTELIRLADGLPASHEPLLPIATFGQNSPGLHGMAALVAKASGLPADRAVLLLGCLALVVLALSIDRILRALLPEVPRAARGLSAFAILLLARNPQLFVTWGGLPTIASIALVFYGFAETLEWTDRFEWRRAVRAGVIGAGAVMTHLLPVVAALYVAVPIALVLGWRRRSTAAFANAALAAGVAGLLVIRFVRRTSLVPSTSTVEWARDWIRGELHHAAVPQGLVFGHFAWSAETMNYLALPFFWLVFLGLFGSIALAAWIVVRGRRPTFAWRVGLAILAILAALHFASLTELLPYWMALYPFRVHLFLLVPAAAALAESFAWMVSRPALRRSAFAAFALLALATAWSLRRAGPNGDRDLGGLALDAAARTMIDTMNARVGSEDLEAIAWIAANTPPDAVIANNEADGGQLVPARAHRQVTRPHYQKFWYEDQLARWAATHPPGWIFLGAHPSPAYSVEWSAPAIDASRDWEIVFRSGEARVYRKVAP